LADSQTIIQDSAAHHLAHQFADPEQQREAGTLGMWVFLATEVLFFGALFCAYTIYRTNYAFAFDKASLKLDVVLGTINTAVLICSSFTMALAVYSAGKGRNGAIIFFLILTILLGLVFLGIKAYEYHSKFVEHLVPGASFAFEGLEGADLHHAEIYFSLYFAMTGLHAFHMIVGVGILATLILMARRKRFSAGYNTPVELSGLYWHFVDIIWIFLYPLLYLIGRHLKGG
jgi:cytochrome c oxidase subunit 3